MLWQGSPTSKSPLERCECVDETHWYHAQIDSDVFPIVCDTVARPLRDRTLITTIRSVCPRMFVLNRNKMQWNLRLLQRAIRAVRLKRRNRALLAFETVASVRKIVRNNPRALVEWSYWRRRNARFGVFTKQLPENVYGKGGQKTGNDPVLVVITSHWTDPASCNCFSRIPRAIYSMLKARSFQ